MIAFHQDDLFIESTELREPPAIRLFWKGKSNARNPSKVLDPFFRSVSARARELGAPLEMHFEEIEHFNSSTVTALIQLIQRLRAQGTPLVLVFDPTLKWQKLSFDALRIFEKPDGMLTIREST